jgi:hypothetical protein
MTRTVLFVCPHGAGKSRLAAAFFNRVAPTGWRATSAGQEPDPVLSPLAANLLGGDPAAAWLDREPPRPIAAVGAADRMIAIDTEVPGAERWSLVQPELDAAARDDLRDRAEALAQEITRHDLDGRG